jgi:hypothetical protein
VNQARPVCQVIQALYDSRRYDRATFPWALDRQERFHMPLGRGAGGVSLLTTTNSILAKFDDSISARTSRNTRHNLIPSTKTPIRSGAKEALELKVQGGNHRGVFTDACIT